MQIAVIGTGHVGGALGKGWAQAGHEVIFGTRDPESAEIKQLLEQRNHVSATSVEASVETAEVVVLAIPWNSVPGVLTGIGPKLRGKILIDCTNPSQSWPGIDHSTGSGGEQVAKLVPSARVVKAFNTTGFENMENPRYSDTAATMFYAGADPAAKQAVHTLAKDLGFDPVDVGGLEQSHALEVLASLWGRLAYSQKMGRGIAFRLMRR